MRCREDMWMCMCGSVCVVLIILIIIIIIIILLLLLFHTAPNSLRTSVKGEEEIRTKMTK